MRQRHRTTRLTGFGTLAIALATIAAAVAGTAGLASAAGTTTCTGSMAARAICQARQQIKKPYVYGGKGPSVFDCSGLTHYVYQKAGLDWSYRTAQGQYSYGTQRKWAVPTTRLAPGDLLFFDWDGGEIDHVALYVGGGQVIEASSSSGRVKTTALTPYRRQHMMANAMRPGGGAKAPKATPSPKTAPSPKSTPSPKSSTGPESSPKSTPKTSRKPKASPDAGPDGSDSWPDVDPMYQVG